MEMFLKSKFSLGSVLISGLCENNFYVRGVSMCEEWVFLVLGDEPMREDYKKNTNEES